MGTVALNILDAFDFKFGFLLEMEIRGQRNL
jgi:hypothetical protein